MNWLRFALAAAGIAAGAAAVAASIVKKEDDREMDDYLMSDPEPDFDPVAAATQRAELDAQTWESWMMNRSRYGFPMLWTDPKQHPWRRNSWPPAAIPAAWIQNPVCWMYSILRKSRSRCSLTVPVWKACSTQVTA